jgi:Peptidase M50B-like
MGLIALLFWFSDGFYLRYLVLFVGVMSSLYSLWDIIEDLVMRKVNESDASQFSRLCCHGMVSPKVWGAIWFILSLGFLGLAILAALYTFKD